MFKTGNQSTCAEDFPTVRVSQHSFKILTVQMPEHQRLSKPCLTDALASNTSQSTQIWLTQGCKNVHLYNNAHVLGGRLGVKTLHSPLASIQSSFFNLPRAGLMRSSNLSYILNNYHICK